MVMNISKFSPHKFDDYETNLFTWYTSKRISHAKQQLRGTCCHDFFLRRVRGGTTQQRKGLSLQFPPSFSLLLSLLRRALYSVSRYLQIRVKLFVFKEIENAAKHLHLLLDSYHMRQEP